MNNNFLKILIIGTLPSTGGIGGVTIHIQRFLDYLNKESVPYVFFDYKTEPFHTIIKKIRNSALVHIHVSNPYYRFFLTLICCFFHKKLIITFHGKYTQSSHIKGWPIIEYTIKKATIPIVLNQDSYKTCHAINTNTRLVPAFIPPQVEEKLDDDVLNIVVEIKNKNLIAAVTYGYDISYDAKGCEIYGIDFLISFFNKQKNYALIVSDPKGNYRKKYNEDYENIFFITHPHSLYELMKNTDIFIRNTSTDGDSLSVKEALYLKKFVLCSDAVDRPNGVSLFHYSDAESLMSCLENIEKHQSHAIESGERKLLEMYRSLI